MEDNQIIDVTPERTSASMTLRERLNFIQQSLRAPKNQRNDFGGFNYRNVEGILEAVKPLLGDCSVIMSDEVREVGGRIYVVATAHLTAPDGEYIGASAYAREQTTKKGMDEAQITGACSSYARKYALCGLFAIDGGEADPDTMDNRSCGSRKMTPEQASRLLELGANMENIISYLKVASVAEITFEQADALIKAKEKKMAENGTV